MSSITSFSELKGKKNVKYTGKPCLNYFISSIQLIFNFVLSFNVHNLPKTFFFSCILMTAVSNTLKNYSMYTSTQ